MIRKKQQIKTLVFMLVLFVALISIFSIKTEAHAASTLPLLRQNASSSPVSCNASNGKLSFSASVRENKDDNSKENRRNL